MNAATMGAAPQLLAELRHADHIIKAMLNAMTAQQQARVGAQLEAAGVAGDGITRHHERAAAIAAATVAPANWANAFDGAAYSASDAADDIECAIETINGLLRLALDQLAGVTNTQADAAIRGAKRFIDDIGGIAHQLHSSAGLRRAAGWMAVDVGTPNSNRDVLAWDGVDQIPCPAFYDAEESCWFSKHDGSRFDDGVVTHWREIQAPVNGGVK